MQSDEELLDYARSSGSTVYHASCSCMMGNHSMSVVDDQLRVHRIDALRVIDASVMPAVSSTNTNAPTIMIAEKGAAMIKASAQERLAAYREGHSTASHAIIGLPSPGLKARCCFGQETFARTPGNWRDAPIPDIPVGINIAQSVAVGIRIGHSGPFDIPE